ncbi:MAG: hypothetical protein HKM93_17180 [Desulfobacteraceae bacterium]|nr:hypothetical protein [Desulfobacteraceae bacterium]
MEVIRADGRWKTFYLGEGKKRPASDIVIPENLNQSQIPRYLADFFHELATPSNAGVDIID